MSNQSTRAYVIVAGPEGSNFSPSLIGPFGSRDSAQAWGEMNDIRYPNVRISWVVVAVHHPQDNGESEILTRFVVVSGLDPENCGVTLSGPFDSAETAEGWGYAIDAHNQAAKLALSWAIIPCWPPH